MQSRCKLLSVYSVNAVFDTVVQFVICFRTHIGEIFERIIGELGGNDPVWMCSCTWCSAALISRRTAELHHIEPGGGFQDDVKAGTFRTQSKRLFNST